MTAANGRWGLAILLAVSVVIYAAFLLFIVKGGPG